jgi:NADH-quinone oxidoreductase subunit C
MTAADPRARIRERFAVEPAGEPPHLGVELDRDRWVEFARFARHDLGCAYFGFLTAIDWKEQGLEVLYRVENFEAPLALTVHTRLGPGEVRCPSVMGIFRGADWMERECYDLFGVVFEGHADLRRILLSQDWVGHPLRKDYAVDTPHAPYR